MAEVCTKATGSERNRSVECVSIVSFRQSGLGSELYDVLRELGHKVFLDQTALKAGDQLIKELEDALKTSQAGVLIWSSATQDFDWVQREYQTLERLAADRKGFRFVPIRLDRSTLPLFAENRIFIDFADYPDGPNGGELLPRLLHAIADMPLSEEAARFAAEQDEAAQLAANKIRAAIDIGSEKRLMDLFQANGLPWRVTAALGCKAAEGLTKLGRNDELLAMLKQVEAQFPRAIRPKQLQALALARRAAKTKKQRTWTKRKRSWLSCTQPESGIQRPSEFWAEHGWTATKLTRTRPRYRNGGTFMRRLSTPHAMTTTRVSMPPLRAFSWALRPTWKKPMSTLHGSSK